MTKLLEPAPAEAPPPPPPLVGGPRPPGAIADRAFRYVAFLAGVLVLVVLGLIIYATLDKSWDWFKTEGLSGVLALDWIPSEGKYGAGGLIIMTLMVAAIALVIAVPISLGIALFVTEIMPRRGRLPIIFVIDLLAAIPSVVFGLWMLKQVAPVFVDVYKDVHNAVSGIPILENVFGDPSSSGLAIMTAGVVVAVMITPIVTAITREVFATCPQAQKEATLAMGATRWEMIRGAVFPHARSGVVAAVIIGFGRAVGETIAVALVVGASPKLTENLFGPGDTLASIIANEFGESAGEQRSALIGFGLVLLIMTIILGTIARAVLRRANARLGVAD
jgi:phosphate transport system permease protein